MQKMAPLLRLLLVLIPTSVVDSLNEVRVRQRRKISLRKAIDSFTTRRLFRFRKNELRVSEETRNLQDPYSENYDYGDYYEECLPSDPDYPDCTFVEWDNDLPEIPPPSVDIPPFTLPSIPAPIATTTAGVNTVAATTTTLAATEPATTTSGQVVATTTVVTNNGDVDVVVTDPPATTTAPDDTTDPTSPRPVSSSSSSTIPIAAAAAGGGALILLVLGVLVCRRRRRGASLATLPGPKVVASSSDDGSGQSTHEDTVAVAVTPSPTKEKQSVAEEPTEKDMTDFDAYDYDSGEDLA